MSRLMFVALSLRLKLFSVLKVDVSDFVCESGRIIESMVVLS